MKLNRKRLYLTDYVKYFSFVENLNWRHHVNDIAITWNRANGVLFKIMNFANVKTLKTIYYAIFHSYIIYPNVAWAQYLHVANRKFNLQKKDRENYYENWRLPFKLSI